LSTVWYPMHLCDLGNALFLDGACSVEAFSLALLRARNSPTATVQCTNGLHTMSARTLTNMRDTLYTHRDLIWALETVLDDTKHEQCLACLGESVGASAPTCAKAHVHFSGVDIMLDGTYATPCRAPHVPNRASKVAAKLPRGISVFRNGRSLFPRTKYKPRISELLGLVRTHRL
jgi:hypothetical protein